MPPMNDLRALLLHDIQLLLSAEEQLVEALPLLRDTATNPDLKAVLDEHLMQTKMHGDRLQTARRKMLGANSDGAATSTPDAVGMETTCRGMQGLIEESRDLMRKNLSPDVMDAALVGACQKVEHFEIDAYGTARSFADQLGMTDVVRLLQQTLDEAYTADQKLSVLATTRINQEVEATM